MGSFPAWGHYPSIYDAGVGAALGPGPDALGGDTAKNTTQLEHVFFSPNFNCAFRFPSKFSRL